MTFVVKNMMQSECVLGWLREKIRDLLCYDEKYD